MMITEDFTSRDGCNPAGRRRELKNLGQLLFLTLNLSSELPLTPWRNLSHAGDSLTVQ